MRQPAANETWVMWLPEYMAKSATIVYGAGKATYNRNQTKPFAMLISDAKGKFKDQVAVLDKVRVRWKQPATVATPVLAYDGSLYLRHEVGGFPMLRVDAEGRYKDEIVME